MSTESYFLELKEYCNKPLILDYQIEEITYEFFNTKIKTNKWIDFTVWLKIHEKLEAILKQDETTQDSPNYLDDFFSEEFLLSNNSVSILIVKDSLEKKFANIFNMNPDDIQPFIIRIHINIVQENNNGLKKSTHIANKNSPKIDMRKQRNCAKIHHEYNPLSPRTTKSAHTTELNFLNKNDFIPYKPSTKDEPKIDRSEYNTLENDPYSPKPIDMLSGENSIESIAPESPDIFDEQGTSNNIVVPKYKASPILNISSESSKSIFDKIPETVTLRRKSQRSPQKRFVDQYRETRSKRRIEEVSNKQCNNREENKKTLKTEELFGSDDSDIDIKPKHCDTIKKSKKFDPKSNKSNKTGKKLFYSTEESDDTDKMKRKKSKIDRLDDGQDNLDGWLNANKIRSKHNKIISSKNINLSKQSVKVLTHESSSSKTVSSDQQHATLTPVKKLTDEERRLKREQHQKEINALNELNNQVRQRIKPPLNIDFKSLNHIPITTILKTFIQFKPLLDKHFHEYRSQKNRQVKIIEGLDHLALINIVEDNYQLEMLNCLKGTYEIPDDVPCYTDLFMTLMLPEWILALFMKEYKLSREKAIQRLKDQEDAKICSQMDNSVFDFSALENM